MGCSVMGDRYIGTQARFGRSGEGLSASRGLVSGQRRSRNTVLLSMVLIIEDLL